MMDVKLCTYRYKCINFLQSSSTLKVTAVWDTPILKVVIFIVTAMKTSTFGTCHPDVYQQVQEIYLFYTMSRLALWPSCPPIQWVPGSLSLREKWPGCEGDDSPPSSAEVKYEWSYTAASHVCLHALYGDNFTCLPFTEYVYYIVRIDGNWLILQNNVNVDNM